MTCLECSSPDMQPVELTDHRLMTCARCGAPRSRRQQTAAYAKCASVNAQRLLAIWSGEVSGRYTVTRISGTREGWRRDNTVTFLEFLDKHWLFSLVVLVTGCITFIEAIYALRGGRSE